jgi:hypothetical protein
VEELRRTAAVTLEFLRRPGGAEMLDADGIPRAFAPAPRGGLLDLLRRVADRLLDDGDERGASIAWCVAERLLGRIERGVLGTQQVATITSGRVARRDGSGA